MKIIEMKKYHVLCFVIVSCLNFIRAQRNFIDSSGHEVNEKVYFPGKTNDGAENVKRLAHTMSNGFLRGKDFNRIDDDDDDNDESEEQAHSVSIIGNEKHESFRKPYDLYSKDDNESPSFKKRIKVTNAKSSEEGDADTENTKTLSSNRRNSSLTTQRIPPPSLMASASANTTLRVCEIKYAEYIQRIFPRETDTASDANDKEFNGRVLAAPGQYPHMTALGFRSSTGKAEYRCGGSLISENVVITAAHCANITGLQPTKVRIGDLNLMVEENYLVPQIRDIEKIYVHPAYKRTSYYNDIALLKLDREVELTEFVRPIRLWTQETLPFTMAYAMGYGATDFARERTNRLTNLNMTIVPNDECNRVMPKLPETERGILSSQICARDYALNRDTCQGDSGGPLQFNIRGRKSTNRLHYQLIGITSYGMHCRSGYPSIFTRVCSYLDWIEPIVWKDYFD